MSGTGKQRGPVHSSNRRRIHTRAPTKPFVLTAENGRLSGVRSRKQARPLERWQRTTIGADECIGPLAIIDKQA